MKVAVIGCGNIAQKSAIHALMNSGVSSIIVCVDIIPERGKEIGEKFSLPFETSFNEALRKYDFDTVYISTPVATHKEIILTAAQNKKHVLCEKSIVMNPEEAKEIIQCCNENNVAVFEGFMYQFHTQHKFVKDIIEKGEIGTPFHFQAWFGFPPISQDDFRYNKTLGGGAILDAGSYTIHAARHFFNCEPVNIYSILEKEDHEVEIRGSAMLDFENGKTAHLVFGFNNMYQNKYAIWGTKGVLTLERAFALPPDHQSVLTLEKQRSKNEILLEPCNHFIEEIKYFDSNCHNTDIRQSWSDEIAKQSSVLHLLR
jgi:dTDP-3,4-didehydro-2,6-dideoxy-alpha-D-glucose 3-reductase